MSPSVVFKTIVFTRVGKGKAILAVIPGNKEVNPKAVARALGEKKVRLTTQAEAERLTGLQAGGISPLALINKGFDVVLDDSAEGLGEIHISGGERGVNVRLPVKAFCDLTRAQFAPLTDA
jgi:Cys-tRNA(Pro)/Cys-tRNA(Cys) deacylase